MPYERGGTMMTPVTFHGCFGWLHGDAAKQGREVAVLICPGLTHDALNAHHVHLLLADEFAAAGYPAMRFDYPNTGDSCNIAGYDLQSRLDLWEIWLDAVDAAIDTLRLHTGAQKIILCGLRIGAALAALAAGRRDDVAGLILLSPVIKGQSYLRQLWIEARLYDETSPPLEDGLLFQEVCFNAVTVSAIGALDLRHAVMPEDVKIAVFAPSHGRLVEECRRAWEANGAEFFGADFAGLEPLLTLNVEDFKTHPDFGPVLAWLRGAVPAGLSAQAPVPLDRPANLESPGFVETAWRFGDGGRLFGMLCEPERRDATDIVLIVNAGRDPHYGPGRFGVEFARTLARDSIASLRLDFAGFGDSLGPPGEETRLSSLFDMDRSADVSAAIDSLARLGFLNFAAYGLCAGAYHVMRAAVADPRISRLLLVNMPLLDWQSGEGIDFIRHKNMPLRYFLAEFAKLRSWPIARHKILKSGSVLRGQFLRLAAKFSSAASLTPGQKNIAALLRRNVKSLFLFGEGDLGLDTVTRELEPLRADPKFAETITIDVLPNFDHLVSHETTRHAAANHMRAFLRHTGASPTPAAMVPEPMAAHAD